MKNVFYSSINNTLSDYFQANKIIWSDREMIQSNQNII